MAVLERFSLRGRVALVTGASSGLGAAAAVGLAEAGADVAVVARRSDRLEMVRRNVEATGRRCQIIVGDVADPETATRAVEETMTNLGSIDVLLNNAGIGHAVPATREMPAEFRRVQQVNVEGAYWMAQACGRQMRPGSAIVNVSSILAFMTAGLPQTAYAASKAAIVAMTRDLAAQWTGRKGIRVNAIAPGFFRTEMTDEFADGYLDTILERVPVGRTGHPDEFVSAVVFLASEAATYVTGITLPVDGGALT